MPENTVKKSPGVIVIGDGGLQVNLGFVVPGSIYFDRWDDSDVLSELSSLVIVDSNIRRTTSKTIQALDRGIAQVTIVWNAELNQFYSYSMISLAGQARHFGFTIVGSTARLTLSNSSNGMGEESLSLSELRSALIEQSRQPARVSAVDLNKLVESQHELLNELESLSLAESKAQLELQVARKRNAQLPELHSELKKLREENSRLRRRNDALARKALNKLK